MMDITANQKGQVLPLTLVIMTVGAISIAALFLYLAASLLLLGKNQQNVDAYYAADSGIGYALSEFLDVVDEVNAAGIKEFDTYEMNDQSVDITIEDEGGSTYKITSTASGNDSSKIIESYVFLHDYSLLVEGAITSNDDIAIKPGCEVTGNITYTGVLQNQGTIDGTVSQVDAIEPWPTAEFLSAYYWEDVKDLEPFGDSSIDVRDTDTIGPLYRDGSLNIWSSSDGAFAQLGGTVYVTDWLDIAQSGKDLTLDLNGHTIYVDYNGEGDAIRLGPKCTLTGSGCIIAVGDIRFQPQIASGPDDFVLLMSIEGTVLLQPQGDFYGSLVGDVSVELQPGCSVYYTSPGDGTNFVYGGNAIVEVLTYNIE